MSARRRRRRTMTPPVGLGAPLSERPQSSRPGLAREQPLVAWRPLPPTATAAELVAELRTIGPFVPEGLRRRNLAAGRAAIVPLLALVLDDTAVVELAAITTRGTLHAAELLVDLEAHDTLRPMLL